MFKRILAVIVGFLLGLMVVSTGHMASSRLYPPPADMNMNDTEALLEYIRAMPISSLIFVVLSHALAGFAGSYVASRFADKYKFYLGLFVGFLFLVSTVVNAFSYPHSFAVAAIDIFAVLFAAWAGASLGTKHSASRSH